MFRARWLGSAGWEKANSKDRSLGWQCHYNIARSLYPVLNVGRLEQSTLHHWTSSGRGPLSDTQVSRTPEKSQFRFLETCAK